MAIPLLAMIGMLSIRAIQGEGQHFAATWLEAKLK